MARRRASLAATVHMQNASLLRQFEHRSSLPSMPDLAFFVVGAVVAVGAVLNRGLGSCSGGSVSTFS